MELRNPQEIEASVEARFRTFLILWAGILASVGVFIPFAMMVGTQSTPNPTISYALLAGGVMMFAVSFLVKQKLTQQAIDKKDIAALQAAHIVTLALCEAAGLFGLLNYLTTASNLSWFLFAISAIGILLNFPSKDRIRAVLYKQ